MKHLIAKTQIIIFLCFIQVTFAGYDYDQCNEIFGSIITNTQLTEKQKLDKWSNYKNTCSHDSMYYLGCAAIYSIKDISYGVNYIDSLSKSGVISYTKEVLFFLGAGYDGIYGLTNNEEVLGKLLSVANQLMSRHPNSGTGFFLKGCYHFHKGEYNTTEKYYKIASEKKKYDTKYHIRSMRELSVRKHIVVLYRQGKIKDSLDNYNTSLLLNEFSTLSDFLVSNTATSALIKIGHCDQAHELMELRKAYFPQIIQRKEFVELEKEYKAVCGDQQPNNASK
jgi:hypothetical protein